MCAICNKFRHFYVCEKILEGEMYILEKGDEMMTALLTRHETAPFSQILNNRMANRKRLGKNNLLVKFCWPCTHMYTIHV